MGPVGHCITYQVAVGPRAGQKLFTLQAVPPRLQGLEGDPNRAFQQPFEVSHASLAGLALSVDQPLHERALGEAD